MMQLINTNAKFTSILKAKLLIARTTQIFVLPFFIERATGRNKRTMSRKKEN